MDGGEDEEGISHQPLSPFPSPPPAEEIESESQESLGFQDSATAAEALSDTISSSSSKPDPLSDDLRDKIVRQVEYYFSDENLPTDKFLMKFVKKDKEGFVPMAVIASFRKMKKLVQDISLVEAALRTSSQLVVSSDGKKVKRLHALPDVDIEDAKVVSSDGKKVKRLHALPDVDIEDAKLRTVLVENLPDDYSTESIQRIFGDVGNIKNICIRNPHSTEESTKASKAEKVISSKLHALIEYETIEAAEKAVATLNNEKNWRSGMQVELLLKRMQKYGFAPKGWKGTLPEKSNHSTAADTAGDEKNKSSVHHDETHEEEHEEEHLQREKGGRRGRNRGRGRNHSHRQYNINGHGHGSVSGSGSEGLSKPPPGPRMPDGTRGFTMGRGKPPTSNHQ